MALTGSITLTCAGVTLRHAEKLCQAGGNIASKPYRASPASTICPQAHRAPCPARHELRPARRRHGRNLRS